ncbi:MAG TPA: epoxide hydrolase [Candidatus Saccharimonadales bacterium]|jgi:pimeloyl-ACP methyl ester carboxylesterase|nr:epoxide hydrolase [Candidatus Saccharimonadales bacterium]
MAIEKFTINVPDAVLADLNRRLDATRWPDSLENDGWDYGSSLSYMKSLAGYWRNGYNWRRQEAALNQLPQYRAALDGFRVHFAHVRGKGPKPLPLIITHGWPGSFAEMVKLIPLLTDPAAHGGRAEDAFDVVIPSLPGYGFSDRPTERGMGPTRVAALWARLMTELGYERFAAQGGDWGSAISTALGLDHAERIVGIHLNYIAGRFLLGGTLNQSQGDDVARSYLAELRSWWDIEGGYSHLQSTKPQTLGYGLNDSPVGLAAWIIEKFRTWSDCAGNPEQVFTRDELLTNVMIYWVTQTATSSTRLYYETREHPLQLSPANRVKPPVAVALFPGEIAMPPRALAERGYNIARWTAMPRGGHFAAMEQPGLLAQDLREFFRPLR